MNFLRRINVLNFRHLGQLSTFKIRTNHMTTVQSVQKKFTDTDYASAMQDVFDVRERAGINLFLENKEKIKTSLGDSSAYMSNLIQVADPSNNSLIFAEDIKNIIALAETDDDIELLRKLLFKFTSQKNIDLYNFHLGPSVMRLLYVKDKPHEMLKLLEHPNLLSMFDYTTSKILLLDLLYNHNMYENVIKTYDYLDSNLQNKITGSLMMYYFAACYKLRTKASLKQAKALWKEKLKEKVHLTLRVKFLFAMLLLENNECPLDVILFHSNSFQSLRENIRCMVLAKANRFSEIFNLIGEILRSENARHFVMTEEAISFIESHIRTSTDDDIVKFCTLKEKLIQKNMITDQPLETFVLGNMKMDRNNEDDLSTVTSESPSLLEAPNELEEDTKVTDYKS